MRKEEPPGPARAVDSNQTSPGSHSTRAPTGDPRSDAKHDEKANVNDKSYLQRVSDPSIYDTYISGARRYIRFQNHRLTSAFKKSSAFPDMNISSFIHNMNNGKVETKGKGNKTTQNHSKRHVTRSERKQSNRFRRIIGGDDHPEWPKWLAIIKKLRKNSKTKCFVCGNCNCSLTVLCQKNKTSWYEP